MPDPSNTNAPRSITEPRSSFIRDAMAERERRHELLARVSTLEATLAECLHHFAALHGVPTFTWRAGEIFAECQYVTTRRPKPKTKGG